jgi:acyl-[acyl-carrier-protein]-phospholipid O-acyltransferase/long-chain-fatty-acid--[acyl-carrier-protein] ligase
MCRRNLLRPKVADTTGVELTGAGLLLRALVLRRVLRREIPAAPGQGKPVGLLVPPTVAAVVANAAVLLDRGIPINLNYTLPSDAINACIAQAGIRHVLTSRKVIERFPHLAMDAELVYLEDLRGRATPWDKIVAGLQTWLLPAAVLERHLGLTRIDPDGLMTVIFTSGSTGEPKGVMLSHYNVGLNIETFCAALNLTRRDVLIGVLPLFHSFGYTVTLWTALMMEPKTVYHFNPLEYKIVGNLARRHGATILIATPTFLRSYIRRLPREDFAQLNLVITGAERLPPAVADAFEKKFGLRPLEGYGTTELSPVVSTNVPPGRSRHPDQPSCREGTVGRPLPGISVKVADVETGCDLGLNRSGMLLVKGPNVMQGYLHQPAMTAEVIRDGWYVTGDMAEIDADGFIRITGRESRFSKIGGEMVPHLRIEDALARLLKLDDDKPCLAVMGILDPRKGERLVVLHTGLWKSPPQICRELAAAGLPPLWIPSSDSFRQVKEIPLLGTGKIDLRQLKELALQSFPERT